MKTLSNNKKELLGAASCSQFPQFSPEVKVLPLSEVSDFVNEKIKISQISLDQYVNTESLCANFGGKMVANSMPASGVVRKFCAGDILVSNIRPYLKKVWVADIDGGASNDVIVIRAKDNINASYLAVLLCSDIFIDHIMRGVKGVKMPRGEVSMIKDFAILCPSTEEQSKIAGFFVSLDKVLSFTARRLELFKKHRATLIEKLFVNSGKVLPELRFKGLEGDWRYSLVSSLYRYKGTNTFSRAQLNYKTGHIKNIHYGDIHTVYSAHFRAESDVAPYINVDARHSSIRSENYCSPGDMVLADVSENIEDVGKAIEIIETGGMPIVSGLHTILARQVERVFVLGFGGYLFCSGGVREQLKKEAQGVKVFGISPARLNNVGLYYPSSLEEQSKIVGCLSSLDLMISEEIQKLKALKNYKNELLRRLFLMKKMEGQSSETENVSYPQHLSHGADIVSSA